MSEIRVEGARPLNPAPGTKISGCVICYHESDRVADCVRSLDFCDEVVVVDSGSEDGTRERAARAGARVLTIAPFPGHREQKQNAIDLAQHEWVLCLDADERIPPDLREHLIALKAQGLEGAGYSMPRRNNYLGRNMRGGIAWPDRKLRLFNREIGHWGGTNPHDRVEVPPKSTITRLDEAIHHLSYRDFEQHLHTTDKFATISAHALLAEGRRSRIWDLLLRPPAMFLKSLFLKRGFIDGKRGLLLASLAAWNNWLKYSRLWRLQRASRLDAEAIQEAGGPRSA